MIEFWPEVLPELDFLSNIRLMKAKEKNILLVLFALITFGLIQVYSSSYIFAIEKFDDGLLFFKKQLFFSITGFALMIAVMKMPYEWIKKWGWTLWALAFFGILLTFVPGLGVKVNGAQRWIRLPMGFRFEPCELLKISLQRRFCGPFADPLCSLPGALSGSWFPSSFLPGNAQLSQSF